jgi:intraflagellar transport protein 172
MQEAEKLYIMVNEPDLAINMYKKNRHYDQMIRLVAQYRKDLLTEVRLGLKLLVYEALCYSCMRP